MARRLQRKMTKCAGLMGRVLVPSLLALGTFSSAASAVSTRFVGPSGDAYLVGMMVAPSGSRKGAFVVHLNRDGTVDTAYGTNGVARADYLTTYTASFLPEFIIRKSGEVTVSGTNCASIISCTHYLTRLDAAGQLDPHFGSAATPGFVVLDQNVPISTDRVFKQGARLVSFQLISAPDTFAIARYTKSGSLDTTFGTDGFITNPIGPVLFIQHDGKILLSEDNGAGTENIFRLLPDGQPDPTFLAGAQIAFDSGISALEQGNGKLLILARGGLPTLGTTVSLTLGRLKKDGSVDTTFGTNGVATLPSTTSDLGVEIARQSDGDIVAFGTREDASGARSLLLTRFTRHGQVDSTFGTAGEATVSFTGGNDGFGGLHMNVLKNDRILAYGTIRVNTPTQRYIFAAARFLPNGTLDTSYGNMGTVLIDPLP